jgi:hypothetical protein
MGSELTASEPHMRWIMQYAATRALYFVDSRTSSQSVALASARDLGVFTLGRDVFLDPTSGSVTVEQQLLKALRIADKRGQVVIIGHPHPTTVEVLEREVPYLIRDYQWVTVSQLSKRQYSHQ